MITVTVELEQNIPGLIVQSVDVYESIYAPYIVADIVVLDVTGNSGELLTRHGSKARVTFVDDKIGERAYMFVLNAIISRDTSPTYRSVTYGLQFISPHFYESNFTLVNRSFRKLTHADIVNIVFDEYLSYSGDVHVQKTRGAETIQFSRVRPLQIVDYCRRRALASADSSHAFVAFECGLTGFHFTTLESLASAKPSREYFFDAFREELMSPRQQQIIAMRTLQEGNMLRRVAAGGAAAAFETFDIVTGAVTRKEHVIDSTRRSQPRAPSRVIYAPQASDKSTLDLCEKHATLAYISEISQSLTVAEAYGDIHARVGDVISIQSPRVDADSDGDISGDTSDSEFSGAYLITKLRHHYAGGDAGDPENESDYHISFELIRSNAA